jgi:hypothetical protein
VTVGRILEVTPRACRPTFALVPIELMTAIASGLIVSTVSALIVWLVSGLISITAEKI